MRSSTILAIALAASGCSHPNPMTSSEIPVGSASVGASASVSGTSAVDTTLPGFDRAAADIIGSGKFETATFALG